MATSSRDQLETALSDRYRIERELAGGGMSRVFLATETALDRRVVIKLFPPDLARALSIERFRQEIRLAARLQHPHIVPLLAAGEVPDLDGTGTPGPYYTMPFVEGESLRTRLTATGELPLGEAVGILRDMAKALLYAHEHGVVHRDIKPENILLSGGAAVVTDFGVAKALAVSAKEGESGLTTLGVALGTPAYMAPEQAAADPHVDQRADLYAFGCVAYELITGQPPFVGRPMQALLAAHMAEAPETITRRRSGVPPALADLIMRCLEKRPADRPQSAGEILHVLDAPATPSGATIPTAGVSRSPSSRVWPVAVVASLALLILVGLVALRRTRATDPANLSSEPAGSGQRSIAVLPFVNLSGDTANQYFSDGISQEILGALGSVPGLQVAGRTSSFRFRGPEIDPKEVGRQLKVESLLSGTIQRRGEAVRVSVEVVDTRSGFQLWSAKYDRTSADLFALEDEIATSVVRALSMKLAGGAASRLVHRETMSPEGHDLTLRARALELRADEASLNQALALYQRALVLDSSYAPAWAGLASVYGYIADAYQAPRAVIPKAKAAALRAIALDDSLAAGHLELAVIHETWEWNYPAGLAEYRKALALDPNSPGVHLWYGTYLSLVEQDYEGAEREMNRAAALDPFNPQVPFYQTFLAMYRGEFNRALALARRLKELVGGPEYYGTNSVALVYAAMGRWQDCIAEAVPDSLGGESSIGALCAAYQGHPEAARRRIQQLEEVARTRYIDGNFLAYLYTALGDNQKALSWLERAADDRSANMRSIRSDFRITPAIRKDPRYAALLLRVGLPPKGPPGDLPPR